MIGSLQTGSEVRAMAVSSELIYLEIAIQEPNV
jgi:hypothetical protein